MPDYKRHGARYRARRRAVDILFEAETRDVDPVAIVEDRAQLSQNPLNAVAPVADYTRNIVAGAAEKLDDLDDAIERHLSEDWELFRLPAVDRQILRVAAWEILFNDEVDAPVSIAEGVEMAAEYSGAQAAPYINVVLDGIAQRAASNSPFAGEGAEDAYPVEDESVPADEHSEDPGLEQSEDTDAATAHEIAESTEDLEAGDPAAEEPRT
ncbi:transcription antitermination factor NusB [Corynebacterium pilbarense]|uniref:Transcription antitermination protein NusB n=1 Tax=Corynebacterium pilbarense TaxID=1288393 RepID=A0A9Q4IFH1_9CORY|nr:transcription antitermination factor NusB [Corynebacterium pilbarense]MCZ2219963.1 transcription antitermination factor NusB [Corynebacterium pilbarense]